MAIGPASSMKIAIVGGGISGIAAARMLHPAAAVTVFERAARIGGLVRCEELPAGLYHQLGGHVFNTKSPAVAAWFWQYFNQAAEFHHLTRDARILLGGLSVGYPLENHLYQLPAGLCAAAVADFVAIARREAVAAPANFRDFLQATFGSTLCEAYFFPYNLKLWRCDLAGIPLGWLEGKLPMPRAADVLLSNVLRQQEAAMVHAQFFYPRLGGSQFIMDRLAAGLDVRLQCDVTRLARQANGQWLVNDWPQTYDHVVYSGDVRALGGLLSPTLDLPEFGRLRALRTRGITNVFCHCDPTTVSWLYLPDPAFRANRIIYTGAFSPANNRDGRMTCVVAFAHGEPEATITADLAALPGNLERIATNHVRDAYVIQENDTRDTVARLQSALETRGLHLLGRFAEWEYYNMDKCMEAALRVVASLGFNHLTPNPASAAPHCAKG